MPSVRCVVKLVSDKNRKVDVEIIKGKGDSLLWKVIKSAGGNLQLFANEGTWEIFAGMVLLWYETTGAERKKMVPGYTKLPTLVIHPDNDSFFEDVANHGKTIETTEDTLYNANPSENKVACRITRMN